MDAGIGAKATVLDCMGGDGEGNCASLQAAHPVLWGEVAWGRKETQSASVATANHLA